MADQAKVKKPFYKKWWVILIAVLVVLTIIGALSGDKTSDDAGKAAVPATPPQAEKQPVVPPAAPAAPVTQPVPVPEPAAVVQVPDFVKARGAVCDTYKSQANDIKKSEVFNDYFNNFNSKDPALTMSEVKGVVTGIETPQGGDFVWVKVDASWGELSNNDVLVDGSALLGKSPRSIRKGTEIYKLLGELQEGQTVVVAVDRVLPEKNPFSEKEGVCGDAWLVKFTSIRPLQ